jgi:hypothetical protein
MDAEAWKDLEQPETAAAPEESAATHRTLLQLLEERSDVEVTALTADRLAFDLDFLLQALVQAETRHHVADTDWRAAQRLRRHAHKHEDVELRYWTAIEVEHFQRVVPQYAAQCRRYWAQWWRHWDALLKYRLPEDLHTTLHAIADAEGRSGLDQIIVFLRAGVARWQAQHPPS